MCQLMTASLLASVCCLMVTVCFIDHARATLEEECQDYTRRPKFVDHQLISNDAQMTYYCNLSSCANSMSNLKLPMPWCISSSHILYNGQDNSWSKYFDIVNCTLVDNVSVLTLQWNFSALSSVENIQADGVPTVYCVCKECTDHAISACSGNSLSRYFVVTPVVSSCDPLPTDATVTTTDKNKFESTSDYFVPDPTTTHSEISTTHYEGRTSGIFMIQSEATLGFSMTRDKDTLDISTTHMYGEGTSTKTVTPMCTNLTTTSVTEVTMTTTVLCSEAVSMSTMFVSRSIPRDPLPPTDSELNTLPLQVSLGAVVPLLVIALIVFFFSTGVCYGKRKSKYGNTNPDAVNGISIVMTPDSEPND